jgi:hypothetical protein
MGESEYTITLEAVGEGLTELRLSLCSRSDILFDDREDGRSTRVVDRQFRSESYAVAAGLILCARILPRAVDAVKDIVVEHLRSKRTTVKIKHPGGFEVSFTGPSADDKMIEVLADALTKRDPPRVP